MMSTKQKVMFMTQNQSMYKKKVQMEHWDVLLSKENKEIIKNKLKTYLMGRQYSLVKSTLEHVLA